MFKVLKIDQQASLMKFSRTTVRKTDCQQQYALLILQGAYQALTVRYTVSLICKSFEDFNILIMEERIS